MDKPSVPKFDANSNRYDQSTYSGRFRGFLDVIDPRSMLLSDEKIQESLNLLQMNKEKKLDPNVSDEDLWEAKKIKDSCVHPVTGEVIFPLFRMSAFVPTNVPLVAGMLNTTSIPGTLFWQWANQSYNSAINYANRSGSGSEISDIATSYGIAVSVSCSLALGFRWLGQKGPKVVRTVASIPFVVPFIAVASAGSANMYFSRRNELINGVTVFDEDNNEMGISKVAAQQGVLKTIVSRSIMLPIPTMVFPHFIMQAVPKSVGPRVRMFTELAVITMAISLALPATIAIFPQKLEFNVADLEPEFQNLKDKNGQKVEKLYSNKGL